MGSPYKENFENLLNSKEVKNLFTMLSNKEYPPTQEGIHTAVDEFSTTLNSIAMQVFPQQKKKKKIMPKVRKKMVRPKLLCLKI